MKFKAVLFIFVLFIVIPAFTQDYSFYVSGYVIDSKTKAGLSNVNISVDRTSLGGTTNEEGYYNLKINKLPSLLVFSHIGYKSTQFLVKSSRNSRIRIFMNPETREMNEVVVTGHRIKKLFKKEALYILDYEIVDNNLLFIAYVNKNIRNSKLFLASLMGDTITSVKVRKPRELYLDCFNNIHLLCGDTAWQIFPEENKLWMIYPTRIQDFYDNIYPVKAELDGRLYYQSYQRQGQVLTTYYLDQWYRKPVTLSIIRDSLSLVLQEDEQRFRSMGSSIGMAPPMKRRQHPVSAPLFKLDNQVIIFNFINDRIEFYTKFGEQIKEIPLTFHKKEVPLMLIFKTIEIDRSFTQEILLDEGTKKFYALFENNGIYKLAEINTETGEIINVIKIPKFPFVNKIRIHNNMVYFLYMQKITPNYMSIYRMEL